MKYKIEKNNHPVYLQIYKQIKEDIINCNYPYNTKLPSKRLLADETETSTVTVEHAYALLCEEGYIETRERSGYIVIFRKTDGFAAALEQTADSIERGAPHSYPDFPLSVLSKTMRKVLTERGDRLLEKSPSGGCYELRDALRLYLARNRGMRAEAEQIIIGSGSEYLYRLIAELPVVVVPPVCNVKVDCTGLRSSHLDSCHLEC